MYISKGNKKVNAAIFNLPAIVTCGDNLKCHKFCYALKAERIYPQVIPSRLTNLVYSLCDDFIYNAIDLIEKTGKSIVRIHESGDFYSAEYLYKWYLICELLPQIKFYAYSKQLKTIDKLNVKKPDNLTLIKSFDTIDTIESVYCKAPFNKTAVIKTNKTNCKALLNKSNKCMINCRKCIDKTTKCIIFSKH